VCRTVTLLLVDGDGRVTGRLPPFEVDLPYWQEMSDVVAGARRAYGVDVTVLRLVSADRDRPHGGAVTYLAEVDRAPAVSVDRVALELDDHPARADYARPGGPAASLRWAADRLARLGRGAVTAAAQQRTWNLSAIWRLDTTTGPVWLKQVPRFFAHEPAVLDWLAGHGAAVPPLLAADDGRMLLDHVDGEDLYDAGPAVRAAIAEDMHPIQAVAAGRLAELRALGVPDRRAPHLREAVAATVAAHGHGDPRLTALVEALPARLADVAACGLPDTLLHGDLHPGNVRGGTGRRTLIDWGDSCVGHPAFDIMRLAEGLSEVDSARLLDEWAGRWRAEVPGCDPERAVALLRPVTALRNAAAYADFLAHIEPSEHPYHAADVDDWLARAMEAADLAA
jgi:Ser/Thr protein kinase RdoA (MazF antagonist)